MFRPWRSFPAMVVLGFVLGLATGGTPDYSREIATVVLIVAMTLALTEIRLAGISVRTELRAFGTAFGWNYVALSGVILAIAFLTPDPDLRAGWVVMAAVPSAIAVIPMTSIVRGNVRSALLSSALLYVAALGLVPAITLLFAGRAVPPIDIAIQTFLQIGVPLLASRALVRVPGVETWRPTAVNLCFLGFVTVIVGANRDVFGDLGLVLSLTAAGLLRTFGVALGILGLARALRRPHEDVAAWTLFGSYKNLGLTALLAISLFEEEAAVPAIVTLFFEILLLVALQRLLGRRAGGP